MRYPEFLKERGTIGFVAPSCGCAIEPYKTGFDNAQKKWREMGYQMQLGPNCYAGDGVGISSTPQACGQELTEGYCDKNSDILISCGGGELMCEILDHVDFGRIGKANPKWYMGYSDNTNFTFLLTTLCDTASIYGPCAGTFGMEPWHESLSDAMELLRGDKLAMSGYDRWERESLKDEEHPCVPYNLTEPSVIKYLLSDGRTNVDSLVIAGERADAAVTPQIDFSGRLLGGCMDCLVNLLGTGYDRVTDFVERYQGDGILWFLEACDLNLMGIRRAMWQMEHAGWFRHCSGFLIGRPRVGMNVSEFGIDEYQAVTEMLRKYNVPILMDLDIGHISPMMPLICGSMARVVSDGSTYQVEMSLQ
ncbi:MAG: LD-carboxypeptidase [Lachnospiraceae bacterium]|nr:LD-carboxypeptidase [Lachnospiraceae bacterium]